MTNRSLINIYNISPARLVQFLLRQVLSNSNWLTLRLLHFRQVAPGLTAITATATLARS